MDSLLSSPSWPFAVLLLGIVAIVLMITRFKFHPFVALILAAIFVGLISPDLPLEGLSKNAAANPVLASIEHTMKSFGNLAGGIAWVIALAAIIGTAMMESGAAERIVNGLLDTMGEKRAPAALLISGFVLSIPVFFDTVFFLLIPLAIALASKTGKNYVLYVCAIAGGAVITHAMVPPTPGPLVVSEQLGIELGITMMAGLGFGILPALGIAFLSKRLNQKLDIPIRVAVPSADSNVQPPSFFLSMLPILLPIVLIAMASIIKLSTGSLPSILAFLGDKNIAMGLGTAIALWLWAKQKGLSSKKLWEFSLKPLEIAGVIILITAAGGAFGSMIKLSGIGTAIEAATENFSIHYLLLAWFIAAVMKTAQGSSTVAMITAASIMLSLVGDGADLPYNMLYVFLAIGFGSGFISWMNDSGFWVVSKMSGFTEKEALQTWTVVLATFSLIGLVQVMIFSYVLPFK
ncbi:MAG: SLC13 family permease [Bacteroidota bacterium]